MLPRIPSLSQVFALYNGDSSASERNPSGASNPPTPPTRTFTLGDMISTPWQSTILSSDEEPGEEEDPRAQPVDVIPDSCTSRRPPQLSFRDGSSEEEEVRIRAHSQTGCAALSGTYTVVGHDHHIKIFDLSKSDLPLLKLDTKNIGAKDSKVSCMEFRPTSSEEDRGYLLWVGTKEGHIFELDIRTGFIKGIKQSAHHHDIVHIFRHSRSMVTIDESGKALVFSPDVSNQGDISLTLTTPRVVRTTEKQDFVEMLDGKLWTAIRTDHHSHLTLKSPTIRVFDIFNAANTEISLVPTEHCGPVTSATILPSQPGMVYVGHEEGCISMWELDTEVGYRCVDVMKVSASDILSLEGVSNRLWAGNWNGTISAFDVSQKPWLVTNCWNAHPGFPVTKLMINHYAITKAGKLCVASIGGDDQLRLWDGLLSWDWIDKELVKSEASFSSFRDLSILVVSWNCGSARPEFLTGGSQNSNLLNDALHSVDSPPDIIVFGFQEVIDLESRKMLAYNVLLGASGKKKMDDGLLEKVTGAYKRWKDHLALEVRTAMPKDVTYCMSHSESLIGLFSCIFVKDKERPTFDDVSVTTIKRGMKGWYGNKGGIVARLVVGDSSICFVNCHLAAGHNAIPHRNADIAGILEQKAVFSQTKDHPLAYIGGNDGTMILDHEFVVWHGDMNYRIGGHHRDALISSIQAGDLTSLLPHDQLLREIKSNLGFRLRGFSEGPITFNPTYKYDLHSSEYDTSVKHRSPAWCDRVLWRSRVADRVRQLHYKRYEADVSDHRPISAAFNVSVKKFDYEKREKVRVLLQAQWIEQQEKLLVAVKEFYMSQALI